MSIKAVHDPSKDEKEETPAATKPQDTEKAQKEQEEAKIKAAQQEHAQKEVIDMYRYMLLLERKRDIMAKLHKALEDKETLEAVNYEISMYHINNEMHQKSYAIMEYVQRSNQEGLNLVPAILLAEAKKQSAEAMEALKKDSAAPKETKPADEPKEKTPEVKEEEKKETPAAEKTESAKTEEAADKKAD